MEPSAFRAEWSAHIHCQSALWGRGEGGKQRGQNEEPRVCPTSLGGLYWHQPLIPSTRACPFPPVGAWLHCSLPPVVPVPTGQVPGPSLPSVSFSGTGLSLKFHSGGSKFPPLFFLVSSHAQLGKSIKKWKSPSFFFFFFKHGPACLTPQLGT